MDSRIELLWGSVAKMKPGQQMKEHRHTCFQLYYIISGSPVYVVSGTQFTAQAGSYFIVPESFTHSMLPLSGKDLVCYEFKFLINDPQLKQHFQELHMPIADNGVVKRLLRHVVKSWNTKTEQNTADIDCILTTILMTFFVDRLDYGKQDSRFISTGDYNNVTKDILIYVEQYYSEPFSSQQMGQALNYNKNYLSSIFRKNTGRTIIDYLNMIRIRNAVIIFVYYDQDVSSTYECVGFRDISHFSRTFKAFTGVSPRTFKQALADPAHNEKRTLLDPLLNFQICTMDEAFQALSSVGKFCNCPVS